MSSRGGSDFEVNLARARVAVDSRLTTWLESRSWHLSIKDDANYVMRGAGKALRPALVFFAFEQFAGEQEVLPQFVLDYALAIEMLHTYSLVHDDLPSMDNDDLRRGKKTLHKLYGEARAILAGDALLTGAFEILAEAPTAAQKNLLALGILANASGASGMISGQFRDLFEVADLERPLDLEVQSLSQVHREKTGALIAAALELGFLAASAPEFERVKIRGWGLQLGLLFQVVDDLLDVTQSSAQLGKTSGKDERSQKRTYVSLLGVEKAQNFAEQLTQKLREDAHFFLDPKAAESVLSLILNRIK